MYEDIFVEYIILTKYIIKLYYKAGFKDLG